MGPMGWESQSVAGGEGGTPWGRLADWPFEPGLALWAGLLGVPLRRPREAGEKAGGGRVQAADSPAGGHPSSRAPGHPQSRAVFREAKMA